MTRLLSIDPGITGSLCVQDTVLNTVEIYDMPISKSLVKRKGKTIKKSSLDIKSLLSLLKKCKVTKAIIEQQTGRSYRWLITIIFYS